MRPYAMPPLNWLLYWTMHTTGISSPGYKPLPAMISSTIALLFTVAKVFSFDLTYQPADVAPLDGEDQPLTAGETEPPLHVLWGRTYGRVRVGILGVEGHYLHPHEAGRGLLQVQPWLRISCHPGTSFVNVSMASSSRKMVLCLMVRNTSLPHSGQKFGERGFTQQTR